MEDVVGARSLRSGDVVEAPDLLLAVVYVTNDFERHFLGVSFLDDLLLFVVVRDIDAAFAAPATDETGKRSEFFIGHGFEFPLK